ncbi:hypothetical protein OBBRIDRAFT_567019 [Obba rivulosa]|uniref:Uncharacterized protein n=1 Tax=Obba rivulosa TaxID=1052685 RepID=A0A8E2B244_9APHY|nr:hypothetical protein OBBRIDRAFT_567019 [Obba rivulosa]
MRALAVSQIRPRQKLQLNKQLLQSDSYALRKAEAASYTGGPLPSSLVCQAVFHGASQSVQRYGRTSSNPGSRSRWRRRKAAHPHLGTAVPVTAGPLVLVLACQSAASREGEAQGDPRDSEHQVPINVSSLKPMMHRPTPAVFFHESSVIFSASLRWCCSPLSTRCLDLPFILKSILILKSALNLRSILILSLDLEVRYPPGG